MSRVVKLFDHNVYVAIPSTAITDECYVRLSHNWKIMSSEELYRSSADYSSEADEYRMTLISKHDNMHSAISRCRDLNKSLRHPEILGKRNRICTKMPDFAYNHDSFTECMDLFDTQPTSSKSLSQPTAQDYSELSVLRPNNSTSDTNAIKNLLITLNQNIIDVKGQLTKLGMETSARLSALETGYQGVERRSESLETKLKFLTQSILKFTSERHERMVDTNSLSINDEVRPSLPVMNLEEFKSLEKLLSNTKSSTELKNTFIKIKQITAKHFIYECLHTVFSNHFGTALNFNGTGGKYAFNATRTWSIIKAAIESKSELNDLPTENLAKIASDWIKGMRDRGRSRLRRRRISPKLQSIPTTSSPTNITEPALDLSLNHSPILPHFH